MGDVAAGHEHYSFERDPGRAQHRGRFLPRTARGARYLPADVPPRGVHQLLHTRTCRQRVFGRHLEEIAPARRCRPRHLYIGEDEPVAFGRRAHIRRRTPARTGGEIFACDIDDPEQLAEHTNRRRRVHPLGIDDRPASRAYAAILRMRRARPGLPGSGMRHAPENSPSRRSTVIAHVSITSTVYRCSSGSRISRSAGCMTPK